MKAKISYVCISSTIALLCLLTFSKDRYYENKHNFNEGWTFALPGFMAHNIYNPASSSGQFNHSLVPRGHIRIHSMIAASDGNIYAGADGDSGNCGSLIQFNVARLIMTKLLVLDEIQALKGEELIRNTLVEGNDGIVYGGTSLYRDVSIGSYTTKSFLTPSFLINRDYKGGHLFAFKLGNFSPDGIIDLGIIAPQKGIRTLCFDAKKERLYGLLDPTYDLFFFDLKTKQSKIIPINLAFSEKNSSQLHGEELWRRGKALVADSLGNIYGIHRAGRFFKYNRSKENIELMDLVLPYIKRSFEINTIACFAKDNQGVIYGATEADGILFRIDFDKGLVENLGITHSQPGIMCMTFGTDNLLYGFSGNEDCLSNFFYYDPQKATFRFIGPICCYIYKDIQRWKFEVVGAMCCHPGTGIIFFGEATELSHFGSYQPLPVPY